ncbi:hypothetical protein KA005_54495, partial [bacterium]|nr:hypothetical protein [bacterium]
QQQGDYESFVDDFFRLTYEVKSGKIHVLDENGWTINHTQESVTKDGRSSDISVKRVTKEGLA